MRPISKESLQSGLSLASKKRLNQFRKDLATNRDKVIFDDQIMDVIDKYAVNPKDVAQTRAYLNRIGFAQSIKDYAQVVSAVQKFAEPNHTCFRWAETYQKAIECVKALMPKGTLRQLQYSCSQDIVDALPKSQTHAGWTFILTGKKKKGQNLEEIFSKYMAEEREARKQFSFNKPIMPGIRTQGSGAFDEEGRFTDKCKHKTRLVSMIDMNVIIAELKFAKPFQEYFSTIKEYAGGKNNDRIAQIISGMKRHYRFWYSLDYSSFDQTISDWLIRDAFEIIRDSFSDIDDELFDIIVEDFINKNYILSDKVVFVRKGVPSGSMFTQVIDSIVNLICIYTYLFSIGAEGQCIVMGDDNLLMTNAEINPIDISSYLMKNFGLIMNSDKLEYGRVVDDNPKFLSCVWTPGGQWRNPRELLSKMLYPERFRPYGKGGMTPEIVIFGYLLMYASGVRKLIDVRRFLDDNPNLTESLFRKVAIDYSSGAIAYQFKYLGLTAA